MGVFEQLLDEQDRSVLLERLISQEVKDMDSVRPPSSLFKYYSCGRTEFFARPAIRFTQKSSLNDPFELTKRWKEFGAAATRDVFSELVREAFRRLAANKGMVLELLKNEYAK